LTWAVTFFVGAAIALNLSLFKAGAKAPKISELIQRAKARCEIGSKITGAKAPILSASVRHDSSRALLQNLLCHKTFPKSPGLKP
jgi:hypothetical protein